MPSQRNTAAPPSPAVYVHLYQYKQRNHRHPELHNGHGAYRPVINYNEIAIHRRKMASKKIICCLLGAGTVIIVTGLVLLLLGLYVINRQCPFHWHSLDDRCLYVTTHPTHTWASARTLCLDQGAHMVDIASEEENKNIIGMLNGNTWIGLYRERKKSNFQWTTGAPFSYEYWNITPTSNSPTFTECVKIDTTEGTWTAERSCSARMHAACEFHKSYYPFVLIGPVVIACGISVMVLSVEVCKRHQKTSQKGKQLLANEEVPEVDEKAIKKPPKDMSRVPIAEDSATPPAKKPRGNQTVPITQTSICKVPRPQSKGSVRSSIGFSSKNPSVSSFNKGPTVEVNSPGSVLNSKESTSSTTRTLTPLVDDHSSQELLELMLSPKSLS